MATTSVSAVILIGPQKRVYTLCDFTDDELTNILLELDKFWINNLPEYWFDVSVRCNTVESMNIHIQCYTYNEEYRIVKHPIPQVMLDELCNVIHRIQPEGEWLEKQNLYVKFTAK